MSKKPGSETELLKDKVDSSRVSGGGKPKLMTRFKKASAETQIASAALEKISKSLSITGLLT